MSAGVSTRKYLETSGCERTWLRMSTASDIARDTSAKPSSSICRRDASIDAMICRLGDVEACVNTASLNGCSWRWYSSSPTSTIDACRSADIDLCVELVW